MLPVYEIGADLANKLYDDSIVTSNRSPLLGRKILLCSNRLLVSDGMFASHDRKHER